MFSMSSLISSRISEYWSQWEWKEVRALVGQVLYRGFGLFAQAVQRNYSTGDFLIMDNSLVLNVKFVTDLMIAGNINYNFI